MAVRVAKVAKVGGDKEAAVGPKEVVEVALLDDGRLMFAAEFGHDTCRKRWKQAFY